MNSNEEILNFKFRVCDNIQYKIDENGIVTIFEEQNHKIQRLFRKLKFRIPLYKQVALDEISSEVFLQIDGNKTVKEIGENIKGKFGESVNPLYERLLVFLNHIYINCNYIERVN